MNNFLKTGEYNLCFICGQGLCWFTVTQGIHNFKRKLSNKIPLEVTSAISDCPHQESQNCWNLNDCTLPFDNTFLSIKVQERASLSHEYAKGKDRHWANLVFIFSPHLFRHLSSGSFSFLFFLKLESFKIHWKCGYSMETNLSSMPVQYSSVC